MDSAPSEQPDSSLAVFKIIVAGGFGAGKTTLVGSISEVRPLRTEENLTSAGVDYDNLSGVEAKTTTTVAMDFGRITPTPGGWPTVSRRWTTSRSTGCRSWSPSTASTARPATIWLRFVPRSTLIRGCRPCSAMPGCWIRSNKS
jgi:GTPase SAR1 family protein